MEDVWILEVSRRVILSVRVFIFVVPDHLLRVSVDFKNFQVIHHNKRNIVVGLLVINILYIVVDASVSGIPRHVGI